MKALNDRILEVFENLDWSVRFSGNEIEIETWSPEGEDLVETLDYDGTIESLIKSIDYMRGSFDVDEHVEMWLEARHTVSGVPQSVRLLVEDAEAIKAMYDNLYEEISKLSDVPLRSTIGEIIRNS